MMPMTTLNRMTGLRPGSVTCQNWLDARGAVQPGGLVQRLRDLLETGQVDYDRGSDEPQADHDQGGHGPLRRVAPERRILDAECAEQVVDRTQLRIQQPHPHHAGGDQRNDRRQEDARTKQRLSAHRLVQQHGEQHGEDCADGDRERCVDDRVPDRLVKDRIGNELPVVRGPGEHRRLQQRVVAETDVQREPHWQGQQQQKAEPPRSGPEQTDAQCSHLAVHAGSRPPRRLAAMRA